MSPPSFTLVSLYIFYAIILNLPIIVESAKLSTTVSQPLPNDGRSNRFVDQTASDQPSSSGSRCESRRVVNEIKGDTLWTSRKSAQNNEDGGDNSLDDKLINSLNPFFEREYSNELDDDETETFTNNHKTTSYSDSQHQQQHSSGSNSHHNSYYTQQTNSLANAANYQRPHPAILNPLGFYAKFHHPYHNAPTMLANNYLLSLLSIKPQNAHGSSSSKTLSTPTTTTTTTTTTISTPLLYHYQDQNFESHSLTSSQTPNQSISHLPGSSFCGRQQVSNREPRIVGGQISYEGEYPWAVSIQRHGNHHCGGVIVGRRWILTAAHCVRSQMISNLIVRTGGNTLTRSSNSINSHLERDYSVDQIVMHDEFSRYDNLTSNQLKISASTTNNADIALIKLKHDIHWNELAWPVCFPNKDAGNFSGHDAIVIGWGKLNEKSEDFSNDLQKVRLTIIDNKVCQNWFRQAGREMPIDDRIICAGFKSGGKDACHGDSGGPLLSKINGQYVVVGVVSTGIGCARPLLPGLYSRVSSYINWIEKYIVE